MLRKLQTRLSVFACRLFFAKILARLEKTEREAAVRFEYFKFLIDLSHVYANDADLFLKKFREAVSAKELIKNGIVTLDADCVSKAGEEHADPEIVFLREIECFRKAGFSNTELLVIYNLNHQNAAYSKIYRARQKVQAKTCIK